MEKVKCHITQKLINPLNAVRGDCIRKEIVSLILNEYPDFTDECYVERKELNRYRRMHLTSLITGESDDVDALEKEVLDAVTSNTILSEPLEEDIEKELTLGQKFADIVASSGGSWTFIMCFFVFVIAWMLINIYIFSYAVKPFDPYPFIFLNLVLSCLAAVQAPIIMMSQNRANEIDRIRDEHEYKINLKAELEIKLLMEKVDHMILKQNKRLLDIQELQSDYLEDILERLNSQSRV